LAESIVFALKAAKNIIQKNMRAEVAAAFEKVKARDPNQTEFLQAVEEVFDSLGPLFEKYPHYVKVRHCRLIKS